MPEAPHFRIGTRGSDLALWQAHHVRDLIHSLGGKAEIIILSTQGDREQVQSFEKLEGKGFFTKEIEEALLAHRIDIAVHSHKDLETTQPPGLEVVAVPARAAASDVLLIRKDRMASAPWLPLPLGATVGTSSVRRRDQLLLLRPDLNIKALRGNVPTRVERLHSHGYDAIVLAKAGLDRLGLSMDGTIEHILDPRCFVPAPAQGALALQMRETDPNKAFIAALTDPTAHAGVMAERTVLQALEGGCQLPFGAQWCEKDGRLRCFLNGATGPRRIVADTPIKALAALHRTSHKRIHITRPERTDSLLHRLAKGSGFELIEHPLIEIRPLSHPAIPSGWPSRDPDWIWLGSPGAATAAADWALAHPESRIAVPGAGTAEALPAALFDRLDYVGPGAPSESWSRFNADRRHDEHIAIPHGNRSMKRWTAESGHAHVHAWVHYETVELDRAVPDCDAVCFTSPSNVNAWKGSPPAFMVAIGSTTAEAIAARGWNCTVAASPDAFGLWEALGSD